MDCFNQFDNISVINLSHRMDRWIQSMKQLQILGAVAIVDRIEGVPGRSIRSNRDSFSNRQKGQIGCLMSHIKALQNIQTKLLDKKNTKFNLILEDDFHIVQPQDLTRVFSDLEKMKNGWDMCFLGSNEHTPDKSIPIPETGLKRSYGSIYAAHAYIVHDSFVDTLLLFLQTQLQKWVFNGFPEVPAVDVLFCEPDFVRRHRVVYLHPSLILQLPGHSDIEMRSVDYKHLIK